MTNCKVKFISNIDGSISNVVTFGTLRKQGNNFSVSFFFDTEKSTEYVFNVISNKVTLISKGIVSYKFILDKGVKSSFSMSLLGSTTDCEVNCHKLNVKKVGSTVVVDVSYDLSVLEKVQKCSFTLEFEEFV